MALPPSGSMTAAMINDELGRSSTAAFSMNGSEERTLAQKSSGTISMYDFYNKSSGSVMTVGYNSALVGGSYGYHSDGGSLSVPFGALSPNTFDDTTVTSLYSGGFNRAIQIRTKYNANTTAIRIVVDDRPDVHVVTYSARDGQTGDMIFNGTVFDSLYDYLASNSSVKVVFSRVL
ncbi:hypothetical protein NVP1081O_259 [Vibrio phage 1.081.O._10N.286.52.C2]|nr:hypothetical protein NVP1081O_259 [Vibrio phage 1.081.O._10N.286.52.C2]